MSTILIVEDDPDASEIMKIFATGDIGLPVEQIYDGAEALARVTDSTQEKPALVILDLHLPNCSGAEILEAIRRKTDIPVAIVSAFPEDADRLLEKADAVFIKPVKPYEFIPKLISLVRTKLDASEGNND